MPRTLETLVVVLQQRLVLVPPDLVHGVSEEAGEVVLIEDDTLVRVGPVLSEYRAAANLELPHVRL